MTHNGLLLSNFKYELVRPVKIFNTMKTIVSLRTFCLVGPLAWHRTWPFRVGMVVSSNTAFKMHFIISRYQYFHATSPLCWQSRQTQCVTFDYITWAKSIIAYIVAYVPSSLFSFIRCRIDLRWRSKGTSISINFCLDFVFVLFH